MALDLGQFVVVALVGGGLDSQAFQLQADGAQFQEALARHQRHADRAVGQHFQSLFGRQPGDGFAHRHGAGADGRGQPAQREALAGLHFPGLQKLLQVAVDLVRQRLADDLFHLPVQVGLGAET